MVMVNEKNPAITPGFDGAGDEILTRDVDLGKVSGHFSEPLAFIHFIVTHQRLAPCLAASTRKHPQAPARDSMWAPMWARDDFSGWAHMRARIPALQADDLALYTAQRPSRCQPVALRPKVHHDDTVAQRNLCSEQRAHYSDLQQRTPMPG